MALLKDIQNKLNDPNLNPKQRANLQKQLAGAQGKPVPVSTTSNVTKPTAVGTEIGKVTNQQQPVTQPVQPTQVQPTTTPTQPQQPTTPQQPIQGGLDETKLLASGITQEQIDKMKAIMGPTFQANQNDAVRAGQQNEFVQKDIADAKKETDTMYEDIKKRKEDLVNESLQINDQSAKVQGDLAAQEYQKNNFDNIQAQKQFDLDQAKNKAKLQKQTDDNELGFRRAMGAQLGGSFSSEGIYRLVQVKQEGAQAVSDLESQTAIGDSQFAFKAQEISSNYYNKLGTIELDRKAQALTLKSDLNDQLDEIDAKMLASDDDKRKQARDAMTEYFNKLNEVDHATAQATSEANKALFDEKKQLEQEKKEKESVDLSMSQGLGYFANKFGDPIGVRPGEPPKRFVGQYDEGLSKQFGYLVDSRGNAVMGSDGKRINYTNLDAIAKESALSALLSGAGTALDAATLGSSVGVNTTIATKFPAGYKGGQCGTFVRTQFTNDTFSYGVNKAQKIALVKSQGIQYAAWKDDPQVGDILFTNQGDVGHVMLINKITVDARGHKIGTMTESNWHLDGKVHNDRTVDLTADGGRTIYGALRGHLKKEYQDGQPAAQIPAHKDETPDGGNPVMEQLKNLRINSPEYFKELIKDAKPEDIIKMQQGGVFEGGGEASRSLSEFKGNPEAFKNLSENEKKAFKDTYGDDIIKQVVIEGKDISEVKSKGTAKIDQETFTNERGLRKDFLDNQNVKEFYKVRDAYDKIEKSASRKTPAGDMSLVFAYMKILDPGSTVREGEYANAQNAANVPDQIRNAFNKAKDGTLLSETQRADFLANAKDIYDSQKMKFDEVVEETRADAMDYGLDPDRILRSVPSDKNENSNKGLFGFDLSGLFGGGTQNTTTDDTDTLLNDLYGDSASKDPADDLLADLYN